MFVVDFIIHMKVMCTLTYRIILVESMLQTDAV